VIDAMLEAPARQPIAPQTQPITFGQIGGGGQSMPAKPFPGPPDPYRFSNG
jgi:hypothetical protein